MQNDNVIVYSACHGL